MSQKLDNGSLRVGGRCRRPVWSARAARAGLIAGLLQVLLPSVASSDSLDLHVGGDVKGFFFSSFPYDHAFLPEDPFGQAVVDGRLKLQARFGDGIRLDAHHQLTATTFSVPEPPVPIDLDLIDETPIEGLFGAPAQGARDLPQAVDLSWTAAEGPGHTIEGRVDRLSVRLRTGRFHLTAGRQAITFGRAYFFTPLDLVAPFSPVVVDREYKPGIDAVRADWFFGVAGQVTAAAAYAGSWDSEGMIFTGRAGSTFASWDLALFAAAVHRDAVFGIESSGALGPAGARAEGTLTFPSGGDSPFVRATIGADHMMLAGRLYLLGEIHVQTVGAEQPVDYLTIAMTDRFSRGEAWALGRYYAAASATYDATPLVDVSLFSVVNLADSSALLGPGFSWSVADAAHLNAGAYLALGKRPNDIPFALVPQSEFGLYPSTAYVSLHAYY